MPGESNKGKCGKGVIDTSLDYRFAWRWLLPPLATDQPLAIAGLARDEQHWWLNEAGFNAVPSDASQATAMLVNADNVNPVIIEENPGLEWLAAWGSRQAVMAVQRQLRGLARQHCYALLPAGQPRVVVPLSSAAAVQAGLHLHRPGRWLARFALQFAAVLARLGYYRPLQGKLLLIACRHDHALPAGLTGLVPNVLARPDDLALYLGSPEDNRKTVALPIARQDNPVIIKSAVSATAKKALRKEYTALQALRKTPLADRVPQVIALAPAIADLSLVLTFRPRRWAQRARLDRAAEQFLADLARIAPSQCSLADYLAQQQPADNNKELPEIADARQALQTWLQSSCATSNPMLQLNRCHGDFAPWNCSWTAQGFFVYDWEASRTEGLALSDAFYYMLAPFVHVHAQPSASAALVACERFGQRVWAHQASVPLDFRLYLSLWLLERLADHPFYAALALALSRSHPCPNV